MNIFIHLLSNGCNKMYWKFKIEVFERNIHKLGWKGWTSCYHNHIHYTNNISWLDIIVWPLSISYPCLVLILLVKYTVKWKMIALFIIKIKLYRPLKNNLDNFNFWYICFLSDYIFFSYYIWIIVHFHCIWICWVF